MSDTSTKTGTIDLNSIHPRSLNMDSSNALAVMPCDFVEEMLAQCKEALSDELFESVSNLIQASILSDKEDIALDDKSVKAYVVHLSFIRPSMAMIKQLLPSDASEALKSHQGNLLIPLTFRHKWTAHA